jgi:hypothetical protein
MFPDHAVMRCHNRGRTRTKAQKRAEATALGVRLRAAKRRRRQRARCGLCPERISSIRLTLTGIEIPSIERDLLEFDPRKYEASGYFRLSETLHEKRVFLGMDREVPK